MCCVCGWAAKNLGMKQNIFKKLMYTFSEVLVKLPEPRIGEYKM